MSVLEPPAADAARPPAPGFGAELLPIVTAPAWRPRLPEWLRRQIPRGQDLAFTTRQIADLGLTTVCEEAKCPNRNECWSRRTATFMILGEVCTRPCGFCSVKRGKPEGLPADEPERVAEAAARLGLRYVVLTSVTRDDLPDGGAEHFRQCVEAVRARTGARVEVLTPDFNGDRAALDIVLAAAPEVFNHNLETVARLQRRVRRKSSYEMSLGVLRYVKQARPATVAKSGLMLGLGETRDELRQAFADLRGVGADVLTLGQYLQPSAKHLPVERYVPPEEFAELAAEAEAAGFAHVASGPFVRSSYHADEAWMLASAHPLAD